MSSREARALDPVTAAAELRVLEAGRLKSRISDSDIDILATAWRNGYASAALAVIAKAMTNLVLGKMSPIDKGWLPFRSDECEADVRLWVLEQLSEFNPGKGAFAAMISERSSWIISLINRKYSQGGGEIDRNLYQLRAVVLSERERITNSTGTEPSMEALKAATRERLISDAVNKDSKSSLDPFAARGRAIASLTKSGKFAALGEMNLLLSIGEYDDSLDREMTDEGGETLGSSLQCGYDSSTEDRLEMLYNLCLGGKTWARAVLSSHLGLLGGVEGVASVPTKSDYVRVKGLSLGDVAGSSGVSSAQAKEVLKSALNRAIAPHAHWAHLSQYMVDISPDDELVFHFDTDIFRDEWLLASAN
ncbi:MAG: hypothetical protein ACKOW9_04825 [Candidatus Paceibacterota bacterium]